MWHGETPSQQANQSAKANCLKLEFDILLPSQLEFDILLPSCRSASAARYLEPGQSHLIPTWTKSPNPQHSFLDSHSLGFLVYIIRLCIQYLCSWSLLKTFLTHTRKKAMQYFWENLSVDGDLVGRHQDCSSGTFRVSPLVALSTGDWRRGSGNKKRDTGKQTYWRRDHEEAFSCGLETDGRSGSRSCSEENLTGGWTTW